MTSHDLQPDGELTTDQEAQIALLSESDLIEIDEMLLSKACAQWRKVAFLVGSSMQDLPKRVPGIPDIFYAQRVRKLVEAGFLESTGNLAYMRYSEVRIPTSSDGEI